MEEKIKNWLGAGSINIFGRPFCGKDTQGRKLADLFGGALIGGGDILRSHDDPAQVEQVMQAGGIVPSDFYLLMVLPYFSRPEFAGKSLILSAVGRAHGEEEQIMQACAGSGHPLKAVILLDISESDVWQRFEAAKALGDRGPRADDDRSALQNRLQKFNERTMPVLDFYRQKNLLIEVNGALSRDQVTQKILEALVQKTD